MCNDLIKGIFYLWVGSFKWFSLINYDRLSCFNLCICFILNCEALWAIQLR